ncbi:MAG: hypothetical protein Q9199_008182 [Rusavskia elegans]
MVENTSVEPQSMSFKPEDVTSQGVWEVLKELLDGRWLAILQHPCPFPPEIFEDITLNLIHNPNINSSVLFRADILYDSAKQSGCDEQAADTDVYPIREILQDHIVAYDGFPGFTLKRIIVRKMVPRNPELDKPVVQTCQVFQSNQITDRQHTLLLYIPHVSSGSEIPWYHPNVQSLVCLHSWRSSQPNPHVPVLPHSSLSPSGTISVHYRLFPDQPLPLSDRSKRTALHLLATLHKHGQGALDGYTKRVHHDQLVSQQRVQDTYTRLKATHAKRLSDNWVEQTDSSKHVFEDLSIAAFLMELWRDMYRPAASRRATNAQGDSRPAFPGFVDIGCGNGVLVDILLREGYRGWGFDARNRKSWAIFETSTQRQLKQMILVPQPLLDMNPDLGQKREGDPATLLSKLLPKASTSAKTSGTKIEWHNGIFPTGTFIISNHADELTPWTPLLAYLSTSPFLMIPCCSHNLSGLRFRAPSKFNNYSADTLAPSFFAGSITKSKSVAITVAPAGEENDQPRQGSLKDLGPANRSKQPSAYAALCDWVSHLSGAIGYEVEKEMLRLPSTRNTGLICRTLIPRAEGLSASEKMDKVKAIAVREGADGGAWVERAKSLMVGKGEKH